MLDVLVREVTELGNIEGIHEFTQWVQEPIKVGTR